MVQIDIAGYRGTQRAQNQDSHYYLGELCRSMRVHKTSLAADSNSHLHGPPYGQLIAVIDGYNRQEASETEISVAIESLARQLLRDDSWFVSLTQESWQLLERDLKEIVAESALIPLTEDSGLGSSATESSANRLSLTAALVCWPHATIVHVGSCAAFLHRDNGVIPLTTISRRENDVSELQTSRSPAILPFRQFVSERSLSSDGIHIDGWHGQLGPSDQLALGSPAIAENLNATQISEAITANNATAKESARRLVKAAEAVTGPTTVSAVVVKLGKEGAEYEAGSVEAESSMHEPKSRSTTLQT